jgi:hypothetical protein
MAEGVQNQFKILGARRVLRRRFNAEEPTNIKHHCTELGWDITFVFSLINRM